MQSWLLRRSTAPPSGLTRLRHIYSRASQLWGDLRTEERARNGYHAANIVVRTEARNIFPNGSTAEPMLICGTTAESMLSRRPHPWRHSLAPHPAAPVDGHSMCSARR